MNANFLTVILVFGVMCLPWLKTGEQLKVISFISLIGGYVVGDRDPTSFHLYPGPIIILAFVTLWSWKVAFRSVVVAVPPNYLKIFIALGVYSFVLSCLAPIIFAGKIMVVKPNVVAIGIRESVPISFSLSTIAQSSYLIFDILLILAAASAVAIDRKILGVLTQFYIKTGIFFAITAMLEAVISVLGLNIRFWDIFMGASFSIQREAFTGVNIGNVTIDRAACLFSEASTYSSYMVGCIGAAVYRYRVSPTTGGFLGTTILFIGAFLALSTTAVIGSIVITLIAFLPRTRFSVVTVGSRAVGKGLIPLFLIGGIIGVIIMIATSEMFRDFLLSKILDVDGYDEGNYSSGAERFYWNVISFKAFLDSYGIGCGAGMTRASSFLINFIAAYGFVGGVYIVLMVRLMFAALFQSRSEDLISAAVMWFGWFLGLTIANPDGASAFFVWIQFGGILGGMIKYSGRTRGIQRFSDFIRQRQIRSNVALG